LNVSNGYILITQNNANVTSQHFLANLSNWCSAAGEVTAGLTESNDSLPPGLWLRSHAGWLPRTGISSGTQRSFRVWDYLSVCLSVCLSIYLSISEAPYNRNFRGTG